MAACRLPCAQLLPPPCALTAPRRRRRAGPAPRAAPMAAAAPPVTVRPAASMEDYKRVASLHRSAFYPSSSGLFAAFLEWDKASGLEFLIRTGLPDGGRYVVLLAEAGDGRVLATTALQVSADRFLKSMWLQLRAPDGGRAPVARGMSLCYLSNLSVSPQHRRQGLGRHLLDETERKAAEWGCRHMVLHCDAGDIAAVRLYQTAGYRTVSLEPPWMAPLMLRSVRLMLMMKRLPQQQPV